MKLLIALFLIISPGLLIAQNQEKYQPIDSVGWELPDVSGLDDFDPLTEMGSATYLLVVSKAGRIKKVKVLSSTFNEMSELKLRNHIKDLTLTKKETQNGQLAYKGTLEISLGACIDNRDNKN
jgi:hypothetical protein